MKKIFGFATTVLLTVALAACGTGSNTAPIQHQLVEKTRNWWWEHLSHPMQKF